MPDWTKLKMSILDSYFKTKQVLSRYRSRGNPKDFQDFKVSLTDLWDLTKEYWDNDANLQKEYPDLVELNDQLFSKLYLNEKPVDWWYNHYRRLDQMLYQIGLTRVTKSKTSDDLAGWER